MLITMIAVSLKTLMITLISVLQKKTEKIVNPDGSYYYRTTDSNYLADAWGNIILSFGIIAFMLLGLWMLYKVCYILHKVSKKVKEW
ncbi:hypothetical protein ACFQ1M_07865 [Sungkyunkwania multivorans]|uniref:Uncharacterized protein n=1 Tax=Sungkyunkwania multivorans TaxID=1173618 RepID=A0ABW3CWH8_9FLAO